MWPSRDLISSKCKHCICDYKNTLIPFLSYIITMSRHFLLAVLFITSIMALFCPLSTRPLLIKSCGWKKLSTFTQVLYWSKLLRYLYFTWVFLIDITLYYQSTSFQGFFLFHFYLSAFSSVILLLFTLQTKILHRICVYK